MEKNFGELKYVLKNIIADGIAEKKEVNKKVVRRFITVLKENDILRDEFSVYNNIENFATDSQEHISEYIQENVKALSSYTKAQIGEANEILVKMINEFEIKPIVNPLSKLHESIHSLIITKPTAKNIDSRLSAKSVVSEHIKNNTPVETEVRPLLPNSLVAPIYVGTFNKKYSTLDEATKATIKKVLASPITEREGIYVGLVKECVGLVNKNLKESETEIKEKLLSTKDKLLNLKYNGEDFTKDVGQLFDLKNALS